MPKHVNQRLFMLTGLTRDPQLEVHVVERPFVFIVVESGVFFFRSVPEYR